MTLEEAFKIVEGKYFGDYPFDESQWAAFETIEAAAKRYQWLKANTRTYSLDMGGNHRYDPSRAFMKIAGPNLDDAFDIAIEKDMT